MAQALSFSLGIVAAAALAFLRAKATKGSQLSSAQIRATRLRNGDVVFLMCDIQERFRALIDKMGHVIATANSLLKCADVMNIPVIVTEQYPKALLHTVSELDVSKATVLEKTQFSMATDEVCARLEESGCGSVVLFGVETHVCVQQTALDLRERGYHVHVVSDGVSSQRANDRAVAIDRMRQAGVMITTMESVIFELTRSKDAKDFKAISAIAKSQAEQLTSLERWQ